MGNGIRIVLRDADLPFLPALYAQPGQDDGTVQSMEEAGPVFARIKTYPGKDRPAKDAESSASSRS